MRAPFFAVRPFPTPRPGTACRAFLAVLALGMGAALPVQAQHRVPNNQVPLPLGEISVPGVQQAAPGGKRSAPVASPYLKDRAAAVALGKALFWDMQLGSDGKTACASCHFHAGTDPRSRHQVHPALGGFGSVGLNGTLSRDHFPLTRYQDPGNRDSARTSWGAVVGSQGTFLEQLAGVQPGAVADSRRISPDKTVFHDAAGVPHTQVTGRNAPSVINAVYNFRQFWDGRASFVFNGENPFGNRDPNARVTRVNADGTVENIRIAILEASLASQAVGPATNEVEMSAVGRQFADIGRRLLDAQPLATQKVDRTDSVLGPLVARSGSGLVGTYRSMIEAAFQPSWHTNSSRARVSFGSAGRMLVKPGAAAFATAYTVPEANFALFFGLALQAYQSTLVSGETPFDRHLAGLPKQLDTSALRGMALFYSTKAKCSNCHGGPEFTNASVRNVYNNGPLHRMVMGDQKTAVYDEGFYNIGVRPTSADMANGGKALGLPLSSSEISRMHDDPTFERLVGVSPAGVKVGPTERTAVNGSFKTPGLRNVALTAPYFHNGDSLTLHQVVQFYNRGANFARENAADLDADIQPLGLSDGEVNDLVRFLENLTDNRVWRHSAPFDHPQLFVKAGHGARILDDSIGRRREVSMQEVPAVGAAGYALGAIPDQFLGNLQSGPESRFRIARAQGKKGASDFVADSDCLTLSAKGGKGHDRKHGPYSFERCSQGRADEQVFEARHDHRSALPSATFHLLHPKEGLYLALRDGHVAAVPAHELRSSDAVRFVNLKGLRGLVFNESNLCLYPAGKGKKDDGKGKGDKYAELRVDACVDENLPLAVRP